MKQANVGIEGEEDIPAFTSKVVVIRRGTSESPCVTAPSDSHESVFPLALLQGDFNETTQFEEEQLLRWFGGGARAFGLTVLFAQQLGTGVALTEEFLC